MSGLKSMRGSMWRTLLGSSGLRRRLSYQLKEHYRDDLDIRIPIGDKLWCPWFGSEIGASFEEIFLVQEYLPILQYMPPPRRWVDLGCYAGFFSLWCAWILHRHGGADGMAALLVDADERMGRVARRVIEVNRFESIWQHRCGAIAGGTGSCSYVQRPYMGSSLLSTSAEAGDAATVPVVTPADIAKALPPPYDLIKVDIEGAEYELLQGYADLLREARNVCIEWHSWHAGGRGVAQIIEMTRSLGFGPRPDIQAARILPNGTQTGVILFTRESGATPA
jgi:FkbM family methyltransferase